MPAFIASMHDFMWESATERLQLKPIRGIIGYIKTKEGQCYRCKITNSICTTYKDTVCYASLLQLLTKIDFEGQLFYDETGKLVDQTLSYKVKGDLLLRANDFEKLQTTHPHVLSLENSENKVQEIDLNLEVKLYAYVEKFKSFGENFIVLNLSKESNKWS